LKKTLPHKLSLFCFLWSLPPRKAMGKRRPEDAGIEMQVSKESFNAHEAASPSHEDDGGDSYAPNPEPMQGRLDAPPIDALTCATQKCSTAAAAAYGAAPHCQGAPPWPARAVIV